MKTKRFLLAFSLLAAMFASCDNYQQFDPPVEPVKQYLPYSGGDKLTFVSNQNDTMAFTAEPKYYYYRCKEAFAKCGEEQIAIYVNMKDDKSDLLSFSVELKDRNTLYASMTYNMDFMSSYQNSGDFSPKDKNLDNVYALLIDTVKTTSYDKASYSVIVNGKGVVEFSLDGKTVWNLLDRK